MKYATGPHRRFTALWVPCCLAVMLPAQLALAQGQFRGFWADAFHTGFKSTSQIDSKVQRAVTGNYNAIVAEVLAYQDTGSGGHGAYWNSAIVPKASDISGGIDPLAYLCQRAHAYGLEVHAWLVTYRVSTSWPPSGNSTVTAHPEWIMVADEDIGTLATIDGKYCLDPGSPEVQDYLISIVRELVTNYEVDGINWDYIRHTQVDTGYPSDMSYAYSGLKRFQEIYNYAGTPTYYYDPWEDFRRRCIDELVRRSRVEIPSIRTNPRQPLRHSACLFASGSAPSSFTSSSAYLLYQNWRYWMEMGWLDAGMPMNYKREHCTDQAAMYRSWIDKMMIWRYDRHAYCGQGNYLNGFANSVTQLQYVYGQGAEGSMNYSYACTRSSEILCDGSDTEVTDWTWYDYVSTNLFTSPVPTPDMPWRDPATATEGTLWGRVTDFTTGLPVDSANVYVPGQPTSYTDGNGYYVVTLIPDTSPTYGITVIASGLPTDSHPAATVLPGDVTRYDFALGAPDGQIELSDTLFEHTAETGQNLPDDTFTVTGLTGYAPVNYTITDNAAWLDVSPVTGTSNGEADEIAIIYDVDSLPADDYTAIITITDVTADNSPQTVTVNLTLQPPPNPGDFDLDNDVDQDDFAHIQECLTGPSAQQNDPDCQNAKLDGDEDVDQDDVTRFVGCMSGAGQPSDPDCLPE